MVVTSTAVQSNSSINPKYTCDGDNINPPFDITAVPKEAKVLAIKVEYIRK